MSRRVKDFFSVVPLICTDMLLAIVWFALAYVIDLNTSVFEILALRSR